VSDQLFQVRVGQSKEVPASRPANFVTEVAANELTVIGSEVGLPNANRAYYRVVAVDDRGRRSGPSDFAETPRPLLYSLPATAAKVGSEYRYALGTVRSLGDLRTRVVDGREMISYWDVEMPRFAMASGPAWLKIDARSGVVSGVPDRPGDFDIVVTATIDREDRRPDARLLSWGIEKIVSTSTQRVGVATQKFTITVAP
jgi:hypothetical protein